MERFRFTSFALGFGGEGERGSGMAWRQKNEKRSARGSDFHFTNQTPTTGENMRETTTRKEKKRKATHDIEQSN